MCDTLSISTLEQKRICVTLCRVSLLYFRVWLSSIHFPPLPSSFHFSLPPIAFQCILPSFHLHSSTMTTLAPAPQPRGIDLSLPTCGQTQCNSHGTCVVPPGGGTDLVCECELGYRGESCEDTVNGALSLPLTLSVLAVIIGVLTIAFIAAKIRQRQKKRNR